MALADIARKGVKLADKLTKSFQDTITIERFLTVDDYDKPTYAAPVQMKALVDWKQRQVRTIQGDQVVSRSKIDFLRDVEIDERDRITLGDGSSGPILDLDGFIDPTTHRGFTNGVYLG